MTAKRLSSRSRLTIRPTTIADAAVVGSMAGALAQYLNKLGDPTVFQFDAAAYRRDGFGARRQFAPLIAEANGKAAGCLPYHFGYDLDSAAPNLHDLDLYVVPGAKRITNVQFMRLPADAL